MVHELKDLVELVNSTRAAINGKWVPCRPVTSLRLRVRAAWLCLTGKADAVIWPEGQ